jgi:hypothetical protein
MAIRANNVQAGVNYSANSSCRLGTESGEKIPVAVAHYSLNQVLFFAVSGGNIEIGFYA